MSKLLGFQRQRSMSMGEALTPETKPFLDKGDGKALAEGRRISLVQQPNDTIPYTVGENETLASISVKFHTKPSILKQLNKLMSPLIFTGQVLFVPTEDYNRQAELQINKSSPVTETTGAATNNKVKESAKESKYSGQRRLTAPFIQVYKNIGKKSDKKTKKKKNSTSKEPAIEEIFMIEALYLIGEKKGEGVKGTMMLSSDSFQFQPTQPTNPEGWKVYEMVNYRMELGDVLKSAKFSHINPINLDRVDTNAYLHALDLDHHASQTSLQSCESSTGSRDSYHGIMFEAPTFPQDQQSMPSKDQQATSPKDQHTSKDQQASNDQQTTPSDPTNQSDTTQSLDTTDQPAVTPPKPLKSGLHHPSPNKSRERQGDKNEQDGQDKISDHHPKVHFTLDEPSLREQKLEAKASAVAGAVLSEAVMLAGNDAVDDSSGDVIYLRVKLAQKERPAVNSLIQSSIGLLCMTPKADTIKPESSWARHCFSIPMDRYEELKSYISRYYPDVISKSTPKDIDKLERKISEDKRLLRRNLSVLEVCRLPLPDMTEPSSLLTEVDVRILCEHLISSADCRPWMLVYTTERHGFSLSSLYRYSSQLDTASLLVVQDTKDQVFGAMLPCNLKISEGYYGIGDTFLFKLHPKFKKYGWSGRNHYLVNGSPTNLVIGGGGEYGLWLDDLLCRGRSGKCETYDNELLSDTVDFSVKAVEVWLFPSSI